MCVSVLAAGGPIRSCGVGAAVGRMGGLCSSPQRSFPPEIRASRAFLRHRLAPHSLKHENDAFLLPPRTMASGKTLFNARSMSPFCISPRDGDMDVAQFSFATPLMRHRQLGRGSRIFCGVWGKRSCVVDSAGAWSLRCLAHLMTSTQAAMACPSSFATRISEHPRPGIPDAIAPQLLCRVRRTKHVRASPSPRLSASPLPACSVHDSWCFASPAAEPETLESGHHQKTDTGAKQLTGSLL